MGLNRGVTKTAVIPERQAGSYLELLTGHKERVCHCKCSEKPPFIASLEMVLSLIQVVTYSDFFPL